MTSICKNEAELKFVWTSLRRNQDVRCVVDGEPGEGLCTDIYRSIMDYRRIFRQIPVLP